MRTFLALVLIGVSAGRADAQAPAAIPTPAAPPPAAEAARGAPAYDLYGETEESRRWKARVDSLVASICGGCGRPSRRASPPRRSTPESQDEAVARLLSDETLRRGDVVVLPDGPKVFRGGGGERFESLERLPSTERQPSPAPRSAGALRPATEAARAGERDGERKQPRVVYPGPARP